MKGNPNNLNPFLGILGPAILQSDEFIKLVWAQLAKKGQQTKLTNGDTGKDITSWMELKDAINNKHLISYSGKIDEMYLTLLTQAGVRIEASNTLILPTNIPPTSFSLNFPNLTIPGITIAQPENVQVNQSIANDDQVAINNFLSYVKPVIKEEPTLKERIHTALSIAMVEPTYDFTDESPVIKYSVEIFGSLKSPTSKESVLDQVGRM